MSRPGKTGPDRHAHGPVTAVVIMVLIAFAMIARLVTMEEKVQRMSDIPYTPRDYSVAEVPNDEPAQASNEESNLNTERANLLNHYNELKSFYRTDQFEYHGFAIGGPYNSWLTDLEAWAHDSNKSYWGRITAGDLIMLGMEYLSVGDPNGNEAFLDSCIQYQLEHYF